ncbi:DUF4349 domain-containing protein [Dyadobacter sp. CY261]|uniref:DUF4349 domain-containing protein n=1 Tax=Dyadobacter sp. CY261 TaxID=2907203 RepID=UPI001F2AD0DC|nr:DUF4349 domain-containing protein [Dyadobacter sp. CY261]MCF0074361.1 DUF4349 domain-containing protein [Dyadobacter sp. CY261]
MKWLAIIAVTVMLGGCQGRQEENAEVAFQVDAEPVPKEKEEVEEVISNAPPKSAEQKLVKNGRIEFETDDADKTRQTILASVKANGGYIGRDDEERNSSDMSYTMVVHVPTARFEKFVSSATKDVAEFRHRSISTEDVTARYVDTESRIKTKKEIEIRYRALLGKATKVKEILEIEEQLGEIRTDIEAMEAQFKQLNNDVEYATLEIVFFKPIYTSNPFMSELADAFGDGLDNLRGFAVVLVAVWPFVLLAIGVVAMFNWWKKKRKRVSKQEGAELS